MKFALISEELYPDSGGAGIVAWQNARGLALAGNHVTLLTKHRRAAEIKQIQQTIASEVRLKEMRYIPKIWPMLYYFSEQWSYYDRILLNDVPAFVIAGMFMPQHILNKSIVFLHSTPKRTIGEHYENPERGGLLSYERYIFRTLQNARCLLSCSDYITGEYIKHSPLLEQSIQTHYAGIDIGHIPAPQRIRTAYKNITLLTVSRFVRGKGFDEKYRIFKKLHQNGYDHYRWVIIGDGAYREEFEGQILQDGFQDHIQILGAVPHEQLSQHYKQADLFWLLSDFEEAFGLVYLEAQMHGLPCIGYNRYGVKEAINDQKTGFLIENAIECYRLLAEQQWENIAADACQCFAQTFNIKKQIETLNTIMNDNA